MNNPFGILANGVPLTKSQMNLLAKLTSLGLQIPDKSAVRGNPFSGTFYTLEPLAVGLYDFVFEKYCSGQVGSSVPSSVWYDAKGLFLSIWPGQYFDLFLMDMPN